MALFVGTGVLFSIFFPGHAQAQNPILRRGEIGPNAHIYAIAQTPDTVYIGGDFSYVGYDTGGWAAVDTATARVRLPFPNLNEGVQACVPDGEGGWYIGGHFTKVGTFTRNRIAHILADGSVDPDWNPNPSGGIHTATFVSALALSGSTLYVSGNFFSIGGQARNGIAALDATTGNATSWNPNAGGGNPFVGPVFPRALAVSGSTVFAGGNFTTIGGQTRNYIAAIDAATGNATSWNPNANGTVFSLLISGSTLYVGGSFTNIGGQPRNRIAALDISTGNATSWNPDANDTVRALVESGSTIYAGGSFSSIGGKTRNLVAALDATTGIANDWAPAIAGGSQTLVLSLAASGSTIYMGGRFTTIDGQSRNSVAAVDGTSGNLVDWNPHPHQGGGVYVFSLAVSHETIGIGGTFYNIGGKIRNRLAALDALTGEIKPWDPNSNDSIRSLVFSQGTVYVAGRFTTIGGQSRNYIAALDAETGNATSWKPDAGGGIPLVHSNVASLVVSGSTVYAGGNFTTIGGQSRNRIAALDASTGNATSWDPDADGEVAVLAVLGSTIYAGGSFTSIGGTASPYVAGLDTSTGRLIALNPSSNSIVQAFVISNSILYVGGEFTNFGEQPRNGIAAFHTTMGTVTPWNPNAGGDYPYVRALAVSGSTVYAGGTFSSIGGQPRAALAALDILSGSALPWDPNPRYGSYSGSVSALAISSSILHVGGGFDTIAGQARSRFAQFFDDSSTAVGLWEIYY